MQKESVYLPSTAYNCVRASHLHAEGKSMPSINCLYLREVQLLTCRRKEYAFHRLPMIAWGIITYMQKERVCLPSTASNCVRCSYLLAEGRVCLPSTVYNCVQDNYLHAEGKSMPSINCLQLREVQLLTCRRKEYAFHRLSIIACRTTTYMQKERVCLPSTAYTCVRCSYLLAEGKSMPSIDFL